MFLQELYTTYKVSGDLHHASLLSGNSEVIKKQLFNFLENEVGITIKGNADFHNYEYDAFKIEDGRRLKSLSLQKTIDEYQIFILDFNTMTREAQNALLKLFEEPTEKTHFFLITQSHESLLKTLLSRLFVIHTSDVPVSEEYVGKAQEFLKAPHAERISLLKEYIEEKNRPAITMLLEAIESDVYAHVKKDKANESLLRGLRELLKGKRYIHDRSASLKLILEHIALSLPQIS